MVLNNEIFTFESRDVNDALKLRDRRKEDEIRPIYRLNPSYRSAVNQRGVRVRTRQLIAMQVFLTIA
ncbi:hypothetical protein IHE32_12205 [Mycetohabitans rhizoxinica]